MKIVKIICIVIIIAVMAMVGYTGYQHFMHIKRIEEKEKFEPQRKEPREMGFEGEPHRKEDYKSRSKGWNKKTKNNKNYSICRNKI